ncbi:MAG: hypothetical protein WCI89_00660 [bacterium]
MWVQKYLPSRQFTLMFSALALSMGLVFAADYITKPETATVSSVVTNADTTIAQNKNWEATLYDIQAQQGVGSLPTPPDQNTVSGLLQAAQTSNLTDSVGRTLLVNLANAKGQGLGDDIPTQNQLIAEATAQLKKNTKPAYTLADLTVAPTATSTLHTYANQLLITLAQNSKDNKVYKTLYAVGYAADHQTDSELVKLKSVEAEYRALIADLRALPVPQTLAPFHLALVNDIEQIADTYPDIESLTTDPLRGLAGLQRYRSLSDETDRMFINIAQTITKSGILFTSSEPGRAWSTLASLQ